MIAVTGNSDIAQSRMLVVDYARLRSNYRRYLFLKETTIDQQSQRDRTSARLTAVVTGAEVAGGYTG
jgi:hypothetical protein